MAKRFNRDKAEKWVKEHGTGSYLWWLNPHFCDEVPKYSELEEMNRVNLREWASQYNHIIRMFDRDKAEAWFHRNPDRVLAFNNPYFFTYCEKPDDWTGDRPLEEVLDEMNRADFNEWRKELRHRADSVIRVNGVEISVFDDIADLRVTVGEVSLEDEIRIILEGKPDWADLVIKVEIDGYSIKEYAQEVGKDPSGVGKMLKRAKDFLKGVRF